MSCRLDTIVDESLDGLLVLLSLPHVNLEKHSRKTGSIALLKTPGAVAMGSENYAEANAQEG